VLLDGAMVEVAAAELHRRGVWLSSSRLTYS
jgi:hypothetical protein